MNRKMPQPRPPGLKAPPPSPPPPPKAHPQTSWADIRADEQVVRQALLARRLAAGDKSRTDE
jgi:hypothetical protein